MKEFKPKNKHISKEESKILFKMNLKWCGRCKTALSIDFFYNLKIGYCAECSRIKSLERLNKNKTKINNRRKERRLENLDEARKKQKEWSDKNKDKKKEVQKKWYAANKKSQNKKRREKYKENPEFYRNERKEYVNRKRKDPLFVLMCRIRSRTNCAFIRKCVYKTKKSIEMLGCDWEYLKQHIENQFTEGMSWERMGEIHIDHIIPLSSAKTEEEMIRLAHYTNLQPLWAKDNLEKGAKIIGNIDNKI